MMVCADHYPVVHTQHALGASTRHRTIEDDRLPVPGTQVEPPTRPAERSPCPPAAAPRAACRELAGRLGCTPSARARRSQQQVPLPPQEAGSQLGQPPPPPQSPQSPEPPSRETGDDQLDAQVPTAAAVGGLETGEGRNRSAPRPPFPSPAPPPPVPSPHPPSPAQRPLLGSSCRSGGSPSPIVAEPTLIPASRHSCMAMYLVWRCRDCPKPLGRHCAAAPVPVVSSSPSSHFQQVY